MRLIVLAGLILATGTGAPRAEETSQDAGSKAIDPTVAQWSFQGAYQWMPDYHADTMDNGALRPAGSTDYLQLRVVAPIPRDKFNILPRLTIRHYENAAGQSGFGNTELFALVVPKAWDWGQGRVGLGPLVTAPGDAVVARDEWGYGFAAAVVHTTNPWFCSLLVTQSWRSIEPTALPTGTSDANALGIAPGIVYQIGSGWYVSNGDMVMLYDWNSDAVYLPIGVRVGNVLVNENKTTWNLYAEYQTSLIYDSYPGPAVKNSFRLNVSFTMPIQI
jgi:hypothetical protein